MRVSEEKSWMNCATVPSMRLWGLKAKEGVERASMGDIWR